MESKHPSMISYAGGLRVLKEGVALRRSIRRIEFSIKSFKSISKSKLIKLFLQTISGISYYNTQAMHIRQFIRKYNFFDSHLFKLTV